MEQKLLEPNGEKHLFTIIIEVKENCASLKVEGKEKKQITYHEIVGALETQKFQMMLMQREHNIKQLSAVEGGVKK